MSVVCVIEYISISAVTAVGGFAFTAWAVYISVPAVKAAGGFALTASPFFKRQKGTKRASRLAQMPLP
ncbi:hypothetical protein C1886_19330 [Pseudomonas sp. FW300-N1A1]|nr:hypothetical protein C1886_19330 [Pseudomonas sp. FW300-N1A1]